MSKTLQDKYVDILGQALKLIKSSPALMLFPKPSQLFIHQPKGHFHLGMECFFQLKGKCEIFFPDDHLIIRPGNILIVPPGLNHYEIAKNKNDFQNMVLAAAPTHLEMHLATPLTHDTYQCHDRIQIDSTKARFISDMAENLSDLWHHSEVSAKCDILDSLAVAFIGLLLDMLNTDSAESPPSHPKIDACKNYINNHLTQPDLSVNSIAKKINCSSDYLSHLFHKITGQTISQFINNSRLQFAREMLAAASLNISEIAYACGYRDPAYFSRIFTKTIGISPKQYKKQIRRDLRI